MSQFREWGVELIKKAATDLPADVESALKRSVTVKCLDLQRKTCWTTS